MPVSELHVIITPKLKKVGADLADVKNYRPISNLTFISKVVEWLVCRQLVNFQEKVKHKQLAYRRSHYTKTAILKIVSDAHGAYSGKITVAWLARPVAASDIVRHDILLDCFQSLAFTLFFYHGLDPSLVNEHRQSAIQQVKRDLWNPTRKCQMCSGDRGFEPRTLRTSSQVCNHQTDQASGALAEGMLIAESKLVQ